MMFSERLRVQVRDLLECVLIPGLAALMPWPWCFRVFRLLSRWKFLYREAVEASRHHAQAAGWLENSPDAVERWRRARRLMHMVDHADLYLARTRSDQWMSRHLQVDGRWPSADHAGVLCTFHWGAGMWGLRHAASCGLKAHALVAPLDPAHYAVKTLFFRYAKLRNATVAKALGRTPLAVAGSLRPVVAALRAGEQVLAAVDVPADQVSASDSIPFLGLRARVPRGLLRLAVAQRVPVTVYLTGYDPRSGQRTLRIRAVPAQATVEAMMQAVFAHLEAAIRERPELWHFWSVADRFFDTGPMR
jgi:lauroyl/myristoyl acyltransferase